jgi:hypothetical protein
MLESQSQKVEDHQLGKSGLHISVPILGEMSFGSDKWGAWMINGDKVCQVPSRTSIGSDDPKFNRPC